MLRKCYNYNVRCFVVHGGMAMNKKIIKRVGTLGLAVAMTAVALFQISDAGKSGAAVIKNNGTVTSQSSLSPVKYNGEDMYVARATYYDYYSDAQVGTSATPGARTDGYDTSKNTFCQIVLS